MAEDAMEGFGMRPAEPTLGEFRERGALAVWSCGTGVESSASDW
jgi:hypothetical protein